MSEDEISRRLPEIQFLRGRVRDETRRVFEEDVHEYFWVTRASEEYHPPDERGPGGTWLHTKRVFTAYTFLERSFRAMSMIDQFEANCARSAVLLHDAFKYGGPPYEFEEDEQTHTYLEEPLYVEEYTIPDHDTMMADWIRMQTELPEEVAHCVECHGGSNDWGSHRGPEPDDNKTLLVHLADVLASNRHSRLPVYEPADDLCSMVGTIPVVGDEWVEEQSNF